MWGMFVKEDSFDRELRLVKWLFQMRNEQEVPQISTSKEIIRILGLNAWGNLSWG